MKFSVGYTVKISKNDTLLFDATGLPAKIQKVTPCFSKIMNKTYYYYDVIVTKDEQELFLTLAEIELTKK